MYEFLSLKLKCPKCGESLMDPDHQIDNEDGIRLTVNCCDKSGSIWLSSIYGSYNYHSDIELPHDKVAHFSCPHCKESIESDKNCLTCGAPMVHFYLDMGGRVSICSRSGCKNHLVEFENLSVALKKLYQDYGYAGKAQQKKEDIPKSVPPHVEKKDEAAEIIESGAFLHAYCPACKKSLIEDDMLKLKITNGEEGILMLSPYLNVFSSKSTIFLPEDKTVKDLKCFHCDTSLIMEKKSCGKCKSPVARISVTARTKLIDFYICTKKGCKWHGLDEQDYYDIRLEDSLEW